MKKITEYTERELMERIAINTKTTASGDGIKQLWLQDPDGYWIEINDAKF